MALLTQGIPPQPYGAGGRKVILPVKATAQMYEGGMISQNGGACVAAGSAGAGDVCGVAEHDQLGGATDGARRIVLLTDQIFLFQTSAPAPLDSTPYGTLLFAVDDNTVSLGGLGANLGVAGRFVGLEDDGRARVFISEAGAGADPGGIAAQVFGTNVPNTASPTVQRVGRVSRYLVPALSQATSLTLGTTNATKGDVMRIVRTDASAFTLAIVNGGAGAGTLCTLVASKVGDAQAVFDGTNWLFDGCSAT